jgi:hypothetical protein
MMLMAMLSVASLCSFARPQTRAVVIDTVCDASIEQLLPVIRRFCYQFQACPDSLFEWAYLNLKEHEEADTNKNTKEGRAVIQLSYKDRTYDPKTKTGDVAIDIYVLGVRWWKDQHLGTKYSLTRPAHAPHPLTARLKAAYSGAILEGGDWIFVMTPVSPTQTHLHYEFSLTFGRVLSAFISDKIWRNAIEWRFQIILENLIEYAETGTVVQRKPV